MSGLSGNLTDQTGGLGGGFSGQLHFGTQGPPGPQGAPGNPGKSAYQYAVDGGYTGTEAEFAEKLASESGGVTTWEDLGSTFEEGTVLAETTVVIDPESGEGGTPDVISLTIGNDYTVNWNGVPYQCVAQDASALGIPGAVAVGDLGMMENEEPTEGGEPFIIIAIPADMIEATGGAGIAIVSLDGSESVTLSITGPVEIITPVPDKYLPDANTIFLYLVSFLNKVGNAEAAVCKSYTATSKADMYTKEELRRAFLSGRAIFAAFGNAEVYAPCSVSFNVAGYDSAQVFVQQADTSARTAENFPDDTTPAIL